MNHSSKENKKLDQDNYYENEDRIGSYLATLRHNAILPLLSGTVLDIACGDGTIKKIYRGKTINADITDYGNTDIVVPNFHSLPLPDASIDTITIIASITYFESPELVLLECNRILEDNGVLLLTHPNYYIMQVWHLFRERWAHAYGFKPKKIVKLLNHSGFVLDSRKRFMFGLNHVYISKKM